MADYNHLRDSARYQSTTLIGNWNEERELRRSILKDLLCKKTTGTLRLDAYHERMSVALQEVDLTKTRDDEYVHFGDIVQLVHVDSSTVLACDVSDADTRPGENSCAATAATQATAPCARNSLVLVSYIPPPQSPLEPEYDDDTLRYGQKVQLVVHPAASGQSVDSAGGQRPLRLFSKPVSTTHFAKYCRNQLVGFTYRNSFDTVWEVVTPDPTHRALSVGLEVLAGAPVMLVHSATQKPLLVEDQKYPNDFGMELELSARSAMNKGMKSACEMTTQGLLKGSIPKTDSSETYWAFMAGPKVARLPPPKATPPADQCEAVMSVVNDLIAKHGGIYPLERKLVTWASSRMQLPADEVLLLLRQVGLLSAEEHAAGIITQFQIPAKPTYVDAQGFLTAVRLAAVATGATLRA